MNIAFVGTGFVADYYMTTLKNFPELRLCGVFDRSPARMNEFSAFHNVQTYDSAEAVMRDPAVEIVVNLTTPESHFEISRMALEAGKHVYSEKPLAMDLQDAMRLIALADAKGLTLATAPANALSDAHDLVAAALRDGRIGTPRLVYAEMEDGPVFRDKWATWRSQSGARWPGLHEFEIGCTLEHAGYALVVAGLAVRRRGEPDRLFRRHLSRQGTGHGKDHHGAGLFGRLPAVPLRGGRQADLRPGGAEGPLADDRRRQGLDRRRRPLGQPLGRPSRRTRQAAKADVATGDPRSKAG